MHCLLFIDIQSLKRILFKDDKESNTNRLVAISVWYLLCVFYFVVQCRAC